MLSYLLYLLIFLNIITILLFSLFYISLHYLYIFFFFFFFSSRRRHTRSDRDWSSDVCSSDLSPAGRISKPRSPPRRTGSPNSPARARMRCLTMLSTRPCSGTRTFSSRTRDRKSVV